jgi:membrane protein
VAEQVNGRLSRLQNAGRHGWIVLLEAIGGFRRNDDLRQASSLAFATMLALIPALLLLTYLLGMGIGSNKVAMQKVTEFVGDVIPKFGDVIVREVSSLTLHRKSAGFLNLLVLLWAVTPLVATMRSIIHAIFRTTPRHPFWTIKAMDFLTAMVFITGISAVAGMGVALRYLKLLQINLILPAGLKFLIPFTMTVLLLLLMYAVFTPKTRFWNLLAGALTTASLWFLLRPAFSLFLTYNHGYGVAFGSFKSLFIVVIWIYYSQAVFLFGVEVIAALHRKEALFIKRLLEGRRGVHVLGRKQHLLETPKGGVFFTEGETSGEMFHVLRGSVSIRKGDRELAVIAAGQFFGEMSFLLGTPRTATAVALEGCECLVIHEENIDTLMREFPGILRGMLTELAQRLKDTSECEEATRRPEMAPPPGGMHP